MARIGLPGVLKTRRFGYDGKGQCVLRSAADIDARLGALGSAPLLYEEFVPFDYEVSIIGVRARSGEIAIYPLNRNYHVDGILRLTLAPWARAARWRARQPRSLGACSKPSTTSVYWPSNSSCTAGG